MQLLKPAFCTLCLFFCLASARVCSQITITRQNPFTFSLNENARTSAGVFKPDGTLVRTLWSAVNFSAGEHTQVWDGLLDDGNLAPNGAYQIKILSGNVTYDWEGASIGNTSTALTGSTKLRFYDPLHGMSIVNNTIYWAAGYNEGWPSNYKTNIVDPNSKTWIGPHKQTNQVSAFVCSDGVYVYWGGFDPFEVGNETFVFATKVTDDTRAVFSNGRAARMEWGGTYPSVISHKTTLKSVPSFITGMAVQRTGNYLFVSRRGQNEVQVLNKTTGTLIRTLAINLPSAMQVDRADNLWLAHDNVVEKFVVGTGGTITPANVSIPLGNVGAIAISPDNATVIVADMDAAQVKAYSNTTATSLWSLGTGISYVTNATVQNDKFYWKDVRGMYPTFLCYLSDGSFYVGDPQNKRVQHFAANRNFINSIMYLSSYYNAMADPNDPTRIFADFLEFKIDYSKPLTPGDRSSWSLVKNWAANISRDYDFFEKMKYVVTLSNGRTYARLRKVNEYSIVELVEGGSVRYTNVVIPSFGMINKDGALLTSTAATLGQPMALRRLPLLGFDNQNNPLWSAAPEMVATTPPVTPNDPVPWEGFRAAPVTPSGKVIFFDYSKSEFGHGEGYHLGAINTSDNKWLWRTAPTTERSYTGPFPEDGAFDSGNGVVYAGGLALVSDKNIFWSYHGEFWKQSQTNKWNHVYDNGLLVGQFGELTSDYPGVEAFAGGAGNVLTGSVVTVNGTTYLYHNDEGVHGGVHRWKISGINTIQVQTAIFPTSQRYIANEGVDLLEGLVRGRSLANGSFGWRRIPATDNLNTGTYFTATIGNKSYNKFQSPDLFMKYRVSLGTASVTRDLGSNTGLSSWKLWGKINFDEHTPNEARGRGGNYMEVLDRNNLIIARFYIGRDMTSGINVMGNATVVYNGSATEVDVMKSKAQPIEISVNNGLLQFSYANRTITTTEFIDPNADWRTPTTLRFQFFTQYVADDFARSVDIPELRFVTDPMLVLPVMTIELKAYQKEQSVYIDWTSEHDSRVQLYEVEKSTDGQHFKSIGKVMPGSVLSAVGDYSWLDGAAVQGSNYYRIKVLDNTGETKYSKVVQVRITNVHERIDIFPNPVSGSSFNLRFSNVPRGDYLLTLVNHQGQQLWRQRIHLPGSAAAHIIPLSFYFPNGKYEIHIAGANRSYSKQVIKLE